MRIHHRQTSRRYTGFLRELVRSSLKRQSRPLRLEPLENRALLAAHALPSIFGLDLAVAAADPTEKRELNANGRFIAAHNGADESADVGRSAPHDASTAIAKAVSPKSTAQQRSEVEAKNFLAPLSGDHEVPPVDSRGRGLAKFQLSKDGTSLHYQLNVANIDGVTQSHIHIGPPDANGPVVVFLFGLVPEGVTVNGRLAEGTITEADVIARPAIGFDGTFASLLREMRAGNAYVNVHTLEHAPGEIRGQVNPAGPTPTKVGDDPSDGSVETQPVRPDTGPRANDAALQAANFVAPLNGDQEVPPVDTRGQGLAKFRLGKDGTSLDYQLVVANIDGVTQSHIHVGPPDANGPVVVFLFGLVPEGVTVNGRLAEGTITEADVIARPAIGFDGTFASLLREMRAGNTYVNVHTLEHGSGEIRGQVNPSGPVPHQADAEPAGGSAAQRPAPSAGPVGESALRAETAVRFVMHEVTRSQRVVTASEQQNVAVARTAPLPSPQTPLRSTRRIELSVDSLRRGDEQRVRAAHQAALIQALAEMHNEAGDF